MPLNKFGYLMANFSDFKKHDNLGEVASKIYNSCVNQPDYAGGKESENSKLTKLLEKKVFFKNGAEGVFVAIIPDQKISVVVKILDGNARASSTAIAGMISELNIIDKTKLELFLNKPIANSIGETIGDISWIG